MCRVVSCVVGRGCLLWPVRSLGKTQSAFALFHFVLQRQTCPLLQVSLDFLLLHSNPLWWKEHLFLVLVLEGLVGHYSRYLLTSCFCIPIPYDEKNIFFLVLVLEGLVGHHKTIQLQLLWPWCLGPRLELCDIEWFALEINRDYSVIFEFAPRYCILDSLVDYED